MRFVLIAVIFSVMCVACEEGEDVSVDQGLSADMAVELDLASDAEADSSGEADSAADLAQDLCLSAPIARASGRVVRLGASSQPSAMVDAQPLDTLTLSGLESEAVEGMIAQYAWQLVTKPSGSTARLTPSAADPAPSLFLDLAGSYVLELDVTDEAGRVSCAPARVEIVALPCGGCGLHMQIVWNAPEGAGQAPVMGVRYADQLATRWDDARVLSRPALSPDWGEEGARYDDPVLDSDDAESLVRNINHVPGVGGAYRLGVSYDAALDVGLVYATARYYNAGQLIQELQSPALAAGEFWEVGELAWPGAGFTMLDRVSATMPEQIAR